MGFQPKVFSIEEANALIPQLELLLERLDGKKKACERLHDMLLMDELMEKAESARGNSSSRDVLEEEASRLDGLVLEIRSEIAKIRSLGCIPRSLERGWIDFQTERGGQTFYFSWRRGEKSIQFYAAVSDGAERLPLA